MSTEVLSQTKTWQQLTSARIELFAANQGAVSPNSQAVLSLVSSYDSVTFDFSDWTTDQLNEKTTSFFWGLAPGSLDISCYNLRGTAGGSGGGNLLIGDMHAASLATEENDAESGKDIVCIHDWCVEQARAANTYVPGQRIFRFDRGKYAGPLPFPGLRVAGASA
ncbi:hypothetical protein F5X99DRAFT_403641 [Biscogniauxia marginata]|nr:hypothetical protein F5X99DRAFT_403641 [Biscogniauxia marginata]